MLNEQLQDLAKLGREARVIPNYDRDSGSYKGFKLIGVRPNSLYRAIGIRSGDVIMQINGEELNSPGKALELFTKLQNSSGISLDIMRRGQKQSLTYKIE
jgi:general secretion pathway protein C